MRSRAELDNREESEIADIKTVSHEVREIVDSDGPAGICFNMPSSPVSREYPRILVYGDEDFGGFIFHSGQQYVEDYPFGKRVLNLDEVPVYEIDPFMDRKVHSFEGVRRYEVGVSSEESFRADVLADDEKRDECFVLSSLEGEETVSSLFLGRREDHTWTFAYRE